MLAKPVGVLFECKGKILETVRGECVDCCINTSYTHSCAELHCEEIRRPDGKIIMFVEHRRKENER